MPELSREQWMSACHFHDLSESEVLSEVTRRVEAEPKHPIVLLDLDSTLYEVGPRTFQILREWLGSPSSRPYPQVREAIERAEPWHVGYSVRDTLGALGLPVSGPEMAAPLEAIKRFWAERFFTSHYLQYDRAYPGAASFVRKLHGIGAEIAYLTGRDEPGMGTGTIGTLVRDGFPWDVGRTRLLLKKAAHLPDLDHKRDAANAIRQDGHLVASFENEPPNLVALQQLFPDAMHVFVDTVCSDHPAPVGQGLYRIKGFSTQG